MKIEDKDLTFNDTYTVKFNIDDKQSKIQAWFNYYCPEEEKTAEENFEDSADDIQESLQSANLLAQLSSTPVKGHGPNGTFPGNFDSW